MRNKRILLSAICSLFLIGNTALAAQPKDGVSKNETKVVERGQQRGNQRGQPKGNRGKKDGHHDHGNDGLRLAGGIVNLIAEAAEAFNGGHEVAPRPEPHPAPRLKPSPRRPYTPPNRRYGSSSNAPIRVLMPDTMLRR